jgi:hypothetical protein
VLNKPLKHVQVFVKYFYFLLLAMTSEQEEIQVLHQMYEVEAFFPIQQVTDSPSL